MENETEVENFKNSFLAIINNYASGLNQFKEETIRRIENYWKENEAWLDDGNKKMFEELIPCYAELYPCMVNWRECIKRDKNKKNILSFEETKKTEIDNYVNISKKYGMGGKNKKN
ncbi:MAG: hypothetical protein I3274_05820 [Candidatus Moeniiplasma glomeromycotorum]|nr:hypothetical protein [Candidatus Moeniiplasma glomeromycotorum]